jgi:hypothetical protein
MPKSVTFWRNKMNLFYNSLALLAVGVLSTSARAIPIMNENVASSGVIVIYPDSEDPHRFYIAPNVVEITRDKSDYPQFSYVEVSTGLFGKTGIMQMTLSPSYTRKDLDEAERKILVKDSKAEFSALPFIESKLVMSGDLPLLFKESQCDHQAGLVGQMQSCNLVLTKRGQRVWRLALLKARIFTTLQFEYSVKGVIRNAQGGFTDQVVQQGVAAVIDGSQLADYPSLISIKREASVLFVSPL